MQLAGAVAPKKRGRVPGGGVAQKVKALLVIAETAVAYCPGACLQRTVFIPASTLSGAVALLNCVETATLIIDATRAAGTPWPVTSATTIPRLPGSVLRKS